MQADILKTVADWSETLSYQGQELTGTYSDLNTGDDLSEEGLLQTASASFVCTRDSFDALVNKPEVRSTCSCAGSLFFIQNINIDPAGVTFQLQKN